MHSEGKYLLRHDGLSHAQAQVRLCLCVSYPGAEYMVLAIKSGTVGQIRPDTHHQQVALRENCVNQRKPAKTLRKPFFGLRTIA